MELYSQISLRHILTYMYFHNDPEGQVQIQNSYTSWAFTSEHHSMGEPAPGLCPDGLLLAHAAPSVTTGRLKCT